MPPIARTTAGSLEGLEDDGVQSFRGIPYAQPPVGALRFAAPRPPEPWSGVRKAFEFGPSAPQAAMVLPLPGMDVGPMDEDCLYLNVYTPAADDGRRPVLVWIHGGGFVIGSGSQSVYDGARLARRGDAVVVTLNYRLGALGFLHLGELQGLEGAVSNCGMRDQVAALRWVRDNIAAFGGDPDDVTIFGESAGGMSVGTLLGMPSAQGLFRRAIPQSGAAHNVHTRETAHAVTEHFLGELGVAPGDVAALREIPAQKLLDTHGQTVLKLGTSLGLLAFQPVVDGDALPRPPLDAVRDGSAAGVQLLAGTTRDEWKLFVLLDTSLGKLDEAGLVDRLAGQVPDARALVAAYRAARPDATPKDLFVAIETDRIFRMPAVRLVEAQLAHTPDCWMYRFDWESPAMGGVLGACHAVELPFVFGVLDVEGAEFFTGRNPQADALSANAMDAWLAFARSGDPSHPGLPGGRWDRYDRERRATLVFGPETAQASDPGGAERAAWEGLL